jgi:uncharacterized protein YabE (DUF348 family)
VALALVAAMFLLLLAGGVLLGVSKKVTLTVDGQTRTVHTFAVTVRQAVHAAGLSLGARDRLEPDGATGVDDGDHIILNRARPLTLIEDGQRRDIWTTTATVRDAMHSLDLNVTGSDVSVSLGQPIPLSGMQLTVDVTRTVTLTDGAGPARSVTTRAGTARRMLAELGRPLGDEDVAEPSPDSPLDDGDQVAVVRSGRGRLNVTRAIPPPVQRIQDPNLAQDAEVVLQPGEPGELTSTYQVVVRGGTETSRELLSERVTSQAQPRVVRVGTKPSSQAPRVPAGAVWDRLASCESSGNWRINTGNGYYGGIQFDAQTWRAYGGTKYAALPNQASREEQIAVAQKVRDARGGYGAWPACSRKLGFPGDGASRADTAP